MGSLPFSSVGFLIFLRLLSKRSNLPCSFPEWFPWGKAHQIDSDRNQAAYSTGVDGIVSIFVCYLQKHLTNIFVTYCKLTVQYRYYWVKELYKNKELIKENSYHSDNKRMRVENTLKHWICLLFLVFLIKYSQDYKIIYFMSIK